MIKIRYKCKDCNADRLIEVPDRNKAVDVGFWLNNVVMPRVSADHSFRNCKGTHCDVMLPFTEKTEYVGQQGSDETLIGKEPGDYEK